MTDSAFLTYCMALDPGETTGICIVGKEEAPWDIRSAELGGQHHSKLLKLLHKEMPKYVVCETFENRGQSSAVLSSREYIGVVKVYLQVTRATGVWQSASTGKFFWTDDKLKAHGLYLVGKKHARDAVRHYAHWRTFTLNDYSLIAQRSKSMRDASEQGLTSDLDLTGGET